MGIETALIGAAVGGIAKGAGGAIAGARGKPDQISSTTFNPAGAQEQELQRQSIANYMQQQELNAQQEQGIGQFDPLRQQALGGYQDILSGNAFQMTPMEQANIQALRDAQIAQGTADVNRYTQQGIQQVQGAAGTRNLRGQALGALQGQVLQEGQRQIGSIANQANQFAAEQAISQPYQRIAAQSPFLQQGLSYADQLRQRAIENRSLAQNPVALQMLNRERLSSGTTTQKGEKGSLAGAIAGGFGGALSGLGDVTNAYRGINDLRSAATSLGGENQFTKAATTSPVYNWAGGNNSNFGNIV